MNEMVLPLLVLLLVLAMGNFLVGMFLWWRHSGLEGRVAGLEGRVARLEVYQESNLTHAESRSVFERLSSLEGQVQTTNRMLQTVQERLLEND